MRKWMFLGAIVTAVGFSVEPAPAQEPSPAPTQVITSAAPARAASRSGLLGRRRDRRQMSTVSQPVTRVDAAPGQAPSRVQQAQATETTMSAPTQVTQGRSGLLARLRSRGNR